MDADIIIVGAGAAGLMAARELGKAGKKVVVLEARDRIGGRIMPLDEAEFGYPAQGGAEYVHGDAPISKALIREAGLTLVPEDGEIWSARNGELELHESFIQGNTALHDKLAALKEDLPIADFLEKNFIKEEDRNFKNSILRMVEGYDAADPKLMSTLTLRDEWLNKAKPQSNDHRIKGGYGALLDYLEKECDRYGVTIRLSERVASIRIDKGSAVVTVSTGRAYRASKAIVTVALPTLKDIEFDQALKEKISAASDIGFGNAIKLVIRFKTRWWEDALGKDLSKMAFMICNEKFLSWWTQYPLINPVLVGWMAGPEALKHKDATAEDLLGLALAALEKVFKVKGSDLIREVVAYKAINWPADPLAKGSYSYTTVDTKDAYERLAEPVGNTLFFAGEALFSIGTATATVEGALGSGQETARKILGE